MGFLFSDCKRKKKCVIAMTDIDERKHKLANKKKINAMHRNRIKPKSELKFVGIWFYF